MKQNEMPRLASCQIIFKQFEHAPTVHGCARLAATGEGANQLVSQFEIPRELERKRT
jgi:hypothetical protein